MPETRKVNGKPLTADITLTASDVDAYAKSETYTKTQTGNAISAAVEDAKTVLRLEMAEIDGGGGGSDGSTEAFYAMEAEKAHGYTKGGAIDKKFTEILRRLSALENN